MTSYFKLNIGQREQFDRIMDRAGFTLEDIELILKYPNRANVMFQALNEPRGSISGPNDLVNRPYGYVSPAAQLVYVKQLNKQRGWGFEEADFPSIPENVNLKDGEVLLLCVYLPDQGRKRGLYRTIDELWDCSQAPEDYTKWRWDELKAEAKFIRQAPGYTYASGIRWVIFNPNTYQRLSPEAALKQSKVDGVELAGVEGLMANLLFPTWATSWDGKTSFHPWLAGLQYKFNSDWSGSLALNRWDGRRQVGFDADWSDDVSSGYSSPSFREC